MCLVGSSWSKEALSVGFGDWPSSSPSSPSSLSYFLSRVCLLFYHNFFRYTLEKPFVVLNGTILSLDFNFKSIKSIPSSLLSRFSLCTDAVNCQVWSLVSGSQEFPTNFSLVVLSFFQLWDSWGGVNNHFKNNKNREHCPI